MDIPYCWESTENLGGGDNSGIEKFHTQIHNINILNTTVQISWQRI